MHGGLDVCLLYTKKTWPSTPDGLFLCLTGLDLGPHHVLVDANLLISLRHGLEEEEERSHEPRSNLTPPFPIPPFLPRVHPHRFQLQLLLA